MSDLSEIDEKPRQGSREYACCVMDPPLSNPLHGFYLLFLSYSV